MRTTILLLIIAITNSVYAEKLNIILNDNSEISVELINPTQLNKLIEQYDGTQDNSLRKPSTARTYRLSNGSIAVEFYNGHGIHLPTLDIFKRLKEVKFVKNTIDFLKKKSLMRSMFLLKIFKRSYQIEKAN